MEYDDTNPNHKLIKLSVRVKLMTTYNEYTLAFMREGLSFKAADATFKQEVHATLDTFKTL